jgi:hypothetical protein
MADFNYGKVTYSNYTLPIPPTVAARAGCSTWP